MGHHDPRFMIAKALQAYILDDIFLEIDLNRELFVPIIDLFWSSIR